MNNILDVLAEEARKLEPWDSVATIWNIADQLNFKTTPEIATNIGLPWTIGTHRIDPRFAREPIDARLRELEAVAKKNGRAVGIGTVSPVTFERIAAWVNGVRRRGFVLAPVSAVVEADGAG